MLRIRRRGVRASGRRHGMLAAVLLGLCLWLAVVLPAAAKDTDGVGTSRRGWPGQAQVALTLTDPTPPQGTTTVGELFSDRPVAVTGAWFDDRAVTFTGQRTYYRAFIGVAPWETLGPHRLTVEFRETASGATRRIAQDLTVQETSYPLERLDVPPDQGDLLDPAVGAREMQIVAPLYAIYSTDHAWTGPFIFPVQGPITTEFGERRAYNNGPVDSWHQGLDIGADEGTPIVAPAPGRVVYAGHLDIRGNFVAIDHGFGVLTCYFHQSAILVSVGQMVNAGDMIGRVGSTGLSTGPHLHWEVRVQGVPVSPWQWTQGNGVR